ncbi:transposable element Tc1 transposase [Trichonephila clavipes]|nr:transposable element Tc1 transposase [Trichonephila clavipes]
MLAGNVWCLATNPASIFVLTIIEDVSGDAQSSVPILLQRLHAPQALNKELWSGVPFLLKPFVIIRGTLTAHRYVDGILRIVLLPFLLQYPGLIFQQNNAKSHTTRVAMNCLTTYQILSWPAKSPDPSPIEHVWNKMGRRMLMIWTDNWSKFGRNSAGDHQGEL